MTPKPTLVLLPGSLCDARVFRRQTLALQGHAQLRFISYATMTDLDRWLTQLLKSLPERFSLAGFSLGGLIALEILRRAPERVERLAMIASNAQAASLASASRSRSLRHIWTHQGPACVAQLLERQYFHHRLSRLKHQDLVVQMAQATPKRAAFAAFDLAARRSDGHAMLSGYKQAFLIVSGMKDKLCPPTWQQAMQTAQPKAHWVALPRCGHLVPLEAPGQLNQALCAWLKQPITPIK